MKKSSWKLVLCLALAAVMLMCTALAAIEQADVAADDGTTITVTGGKLTLTTTGLTSGTQYVLMQVKTDVAGDSAQAILTAAKAAQNPYVVGEETIIYIDQAASDGSITFSGFQPKVAANSLFILGGDDQPKIVGAMIARGVTISGTATAKGATTGDVTVKVMQGDAEVGSATVATGSTYEISGVPAEAGLTVEVSSAIKGNNKPTVDKYVTRTYELDATTTTELNVELWPKGDVTGNGTVNIQDVNVLYSHSKVGGTKITGYALECGKVLGGSSANIRDVNALYGHTKIGGDKLW